MFIRPLSYQPLLTRILVPVSSAQATQIKPMFSRLIGKLQLLTRHPYPFSFLSNKSLLLGQSMSPSMDPLLKTTALDLVTTQSLGKVDVPQRKDSAFSCGLSKLPARYRSYVNLSSLSPLASPYVF